MSQIVNPISDAYNGDGWVKGDGGSLGLFEMINTDAEPSDALWIWSPALGGTAAYVTKLADYISPDQDDPEEWTINLRLQKPNVVIPTQLDLLVQLRQYYVDEVDQGELIYEESIIDVQVGYVDHVISIPTTAIDPSTISPENTYIRLESNEI